MNVRSAKDIKRLRTALDASVKALAPFRKNRMEALKEYVGAHYGDMGCVNEVPMNILALAVMIYARNMFARSPKVLCTTAHTELKWRATNFQAGINHLLRKIEYKRHMDLAIVNAMFSIGIVKIGMNGAGSVEIDGVAVEVGEPYARCVDLDDWVHDTCARTWDEISFCGNRYRVPLEYAQNFENFDPKERAKLKATRKNDYRGEEDYAETLGKSNATDNDEYADYVELWDLWLPRENTLITLSAEGGEVPLQVQEWAGPSKGPFKILTFIDVPNCIMPVPPCAHWIDLHQLINSLMRKLGKQAKREKQLTLVRPGGEKDGERVLAASDGEMIKTDDPKNIGEVRYGGPDQQTMLFMLQAKDQASWIAGNLDSLGGLAPQAETLGAERLLAQNASRQMAEMQDRAFEFAHATISDLGWWLWTDPFIELPLTVRIPGTEMEFPDTFGPEDRQGDYLDYNLAIDPYSMQDSSPAEKLRTLSTFMQTFGLPLIPAMNAEGFALNVEQFFRLYAKYANMDDLDQLLTFQRMPQAQPTQPAMVSAPKPAVTTRIENRISRPGATRSGKDALMAMAVSGQGMQPKEAGALSRPMV